MEFKLWEKQAEACDFAESEKISLFPKSRQNGLSELAAERSLKEILQYPNTEGVIISKSEDFAEYFLSNKIIRKIDNLPKHKQIEWPRIVKKTNSEIILSNGSTIKSLSSSKTSAASMRLDFIVFDEAGGIDENYGNFKQLFANALPALDQNKKSWAMVIGTSVPGSYYNEMVRAAYNDKKSEFKYYFLPWYTDPKRDQAWYEKQKSVLLDNVYLQYPRSMEDFFYVKEGLVFKEFDQKEDGRHIKKIHPNWNWNFYSSYDHGYVDPACALFGLYDPFNDHLHIFDELYYKMNHQTDVHNISKDYNEKLFDYPKKPRRELADTAIFNRINGVITTSELFRRNGVRWDKADKYDSAGSRELLSERFLTNRITIDPRCVGLIEELKIWRWGKDGVTPEDKNNHAIDALRYMCSEVRPQKNTTLPAEKRREYSLDPITKDKKSFIKGSIFEDINVRPRYNVNSWQAN